MLQPRDHVNYFLLKNIILAELLMVVEIIMVNVDIFITIIIIGNKNES